MFIRTARDDRSMKLDGYKLGDLYLAAIKSEAEAAGVYSRLAEAVPEGYMRHKLRFLASEEKAHRRDLSRLFRRETGKRFFRLPLESPVPMPLICEPRPGTPVADVVESAMDAENAARRFYLHLSRRYPAGSNEAFLLVFISNMERGHYLLLENERAMLEAEANFDNPCP
jgi:rubrerythrin